MNFRIFSSMVPMEGKKDIMTQKVYSGLPEAGHEPVLDTSVGYRDVYFHIFIIVKLYICLLGFSVYMLHNFKN